MNKVFDTPLITQDQSIQRVLAAGLPVLLVFLDREAPQALNVEMNRLARDEAGKLLVVQVFAKDSPESVRKYQIASFPAVATVRDGQVQSKADGITAAEMNQHATFLLGKGPRPADQSFARSQNSRQTVHPAGGAGGGTPVAVSDSTFEQEVLRSPIPVIVDFWAPWCGPCKMVAPALDRMAQEWAGKVKVAKVNSDENPQLVTRYGVRGIPTMLVVKNGQIVDHWVGALPEPAMRSRIMPQIRP